MFSSVLGRALTLGALLLATACAPVPHRPIEPTKREVVRSTDVVALIPQPDLYAQIVASNVTGALGGGLLGALIDSGINNSRATDAEAAVAPLRDALLGFDADAALKAELERTLPAVQWLAPQGFTVTKKADAATREAALKQSKAGAVLYVSTDYNLSADFSTLFVSGLVSLVPQPAPLTQEERKKQRQTATSPADASNALYYNTIVVAATLDPKATALEANRPKWAEAGLIKKSLQFQFAELARLIAKDLEYVAPAKGTALAGEPYTEGMFKGVVIEKSDVSRVIRFDDGTVKSFVTLAKLPAEPTLATAPAAPLDPAAAPAAPAAPTTAPAAPAAAQ